VISVAVVGAGFGGVGAAAMLARAGYTDVQVFERGERIGGVWHHNTYPGAACDVPSHMYEFSFAPNPRWSRRYASQPEIQAYLEDLAQRYGVRERVRTGTEVRNACWDEERGRWRLDTSAGPHEADVLITACGQLAVPSAPPIQGLERFAGAISHGALASRRGAVRAAGGGGGDRMQRDSGRVAIQPVAEQVDVYQRSPGWTIPRMDFAYSRRAQRVFDRFPALQRLDRRANFAFHEFAALAMTSQPWILRAFRAVGR
jgi:cation diffusion facilitator CzcD-associated flavoprotein CzcO